MTSQYRRQCSIISVRIVCFDQTSEIFRAEQVFSLFHEHRRKGSCAFHSDAFTYSARKSCASERSKARWILITWFFWREMERLSVAYKYITKLSDHHHENNDDDADLYSLCHHPLAELEEARWDPDEWTKQWSPTFGDAIHFDRIIIVVRQNVTIVIRS